MYGPADAHAHGQAVPVLPQDVAEPDREILGKKLIVLPIRVFGFQRGRASRRSPRYWRGCVRLEVSQQKPNHLRRD